MYFVVLTSIFQIHACLRPFQKVLVFAAVGDEQAFQCLPLQTHILDLLPFLSYKRPPLIINFCDHLKAIFRGFECNYTVHTVLRSCKYRFYAVFNCLNDHVFVFYIFVHLKLYAYFVPLHYNQSNILPDWTLVQMLFRRLHISFCCRVLSIQQTVRCPVVKWLV